MKKQLDIETAQLAPKDYTVYRLLGYTKERPVPPFVEKAFAGATAFALSAAEPRARIIDCAIEPTRDGCNIVDGPRLESRMLGAGLQSAASAVVFVVTIGERIPEKIRELAADDILQSYLLDALASEMVDAAPDYLRRQVEIERKAERLFAGKSYSPGYCDWNIIQNRMLLEFLDAEKIGVTLSEGGMMIPQKTVSGMFGLGADRASIRAGSCRFCDDRTCSHRR